MEARFAGSKDFGVEAVVVVVVAAVPDSAVDSSTLHLQQAAVQFVTAVPVPNLEPKCTEGEAEVAAAASEQDAGSIHVDLDCVDC